MDAGGLRLFVFLILVGSIYGRSHNYSLFSRKFISVNMNDNFRELRIAYKKVLVLETSAFLDTPEALVLRRVTDGRRLVQLVFQHGDLKDCEYTENGKMILNMLDDFTKAKKILSISTFSNVFDFYSDMKLLQSGSAVQRIKTKSDLGSFKDYIDIKTQARTCHRLYSTLKRKMHLKTLSTKRMERGNNSSKFNFEMKTSAPHLRSKRDLFSGWLIFPGTKWCGDGDVADSYDDLGYDETTDSCCRDHDSCPYIIERFTYKYNLFNYRLHTLSHCHCDNKFRRCLKKSQSSTAKLVGQIYFNIIGPQCFKFTKEKVCKKRTWWGTCKKYGKKKSAHPKNSKGY